MTLLRRWIGRVPPDGGGETAVIRAFVATLARLARFDEIAREAAR